MSSNQLKNETSPYLLQHADNPVNWYPWANKTNPSCSTIQENPKIMTYATKLDKICLK